VCNAVRELSEPASSLLAIMAYRCVPAQAAGQHVLSHSDSGHSPPSLLHAYGAYMATITATGCKRRGIKRL